MFHFIVEAKTQSSTFRNPEFENFHKSFLLPPPTTIIGMAGAALKLSPMAAQDYFDKNEILMGVFGTSKGFSKDLWKYNDFKSGSIIKRELLFFNYFLLAFACENEKIIEELKSAFENPSYALTMGSSDSLAKVRVYNEGIIESSREVQNCLIAGDILQEVMDYSDNGVEFSVYKSYEPFVYSLPVRFAYESDYGKRKVVQRKTFSFIEKPMILNVEKRGIKLKDYFIPLFDLR